MLLAPWVCLQSNLLHDLMTLLLTYTVRHFLINLSHMNDDATTVGMPIITCDNWNKLGFSQMFVWFMVKTYCNCLWSLMIMNYCKWLWSFTAWLWSFMNDRELTMSFIDHLWMAMIRPWRIKNIWEELNCFPYYTWSSMNIRSFLKICIQWN